MKFVSVNGGSGATTFDQVILQSIASDGGLYVPESTPRLTPEFLGKLHSQSLESIGLKITSLFLEEIPSNDLSKIIERAWNFPIPLTRLENGLYLLELFHGPTLAFKDVGARFMAEALSFFLAQHHRHITILVATSGDTGSAVAHGFFNTPHIDVFILYPSGKVSRLQEQQMTTLGGNIRALEVDGTFDDCQRLVKQALVDPDINRSRTLTSANSINLARLLPQMTYYAWGIAQWQKNFRRDNEVPMVVVPSGNFGNLTAAVYTKWIGVSINKLVAATNANDVVPQYFSTGQYAPKPSIQTLSNAMDVGNPGNFVRLQYLYKNDIEAMRNDISAVSITDQQTVEEIRRTYEHTGRIIDPHTAVGVAAARQFGLRPSIVAATAHPAKFPEVIKKAIGIEMPLPLSLKSVLKKRKQSVTIPNNYQELKHLLLS
ncbi:MAG: threonine synthase [Ignavibacteriae bacterium]|nr:threonine synthase [Ignavibacteria bacterium]MBI3363362.1 threonine synthase [Ignavibacteriota bacterium]